MITRWWDITGPWVMTACLTSFLKKKFSINKTKKIKFIEKSKIQNLGLEKRLIQLEETLEDLEDLEKLEIEVNVLNEKQ